MEAKARPPASPPLIYRPRRCRSRILAGISITLLVGGLGWALVAPHSTAAWTVFGIGWCLMVVVGIPLKIRRSRAEQRARHAAVERLPIPQIGSKATPENDETPEVIGGFVSPRTHGLPTRGS